MKQICGDCLHYNACAAWNIGSLANTNTGNCINFEHIHLYDSVEVVRCKDCGWWNEDDSAGWGYLGNNVCACAYFSNEDGYTVYTEPNDYCSKGERKEGEG